MREAVQKHEAEAATALPVLLAAVGLPATAAVAAAAGRAVDSTGERKDDEEKDDDEEDEDVEEAAIGAGATSASKRIAECLEKAFGVQKGIAGEGGAKKLCTPIAKS